MVAGERALRSLVRRSWSWSFEQFVFLQYLQCFAEGTNGEMRVALLLNVLVMVDQNKIFQWLYTYIEIDRVRRDQ
jgi:hypothetical protein